MGKISKESRKLVDLKEDEWLATRISLLKANKNKDYSECVF